MSQSHGALEGRLECLDQGRLAEWIERALNGTVLEHARPDHLSVSRDEDKLKQPVDLFQRAFVWCVSLWSD